MLDLDPLHVACEGRFVAFVAAKDAEAALGMMRAHEIGRGSALIGNVQSELTPRVVLRTLIGQNCILEMSSGEHLPRVC